MTVQQGLTATGEAYLQANNGLDIMYAILSDEQFTGSISAAVLTAASITDPINTGITGEAGVRPLNALPLDSERQIPITGNANVILNTLFRFEDSTLGVAYKAKTIYLMHHTLNAAFSTDRVMAIATDDDSSETIITKAANGFVTPLVVLIYDNKLAPVAVNTSVIREVTQIGITRATQAEAEAGTDNVVLMTPLRTEQHFDSKKATQAQAEAGTDNDTLMTPLRTEQHFDSKKATKAQAEAGTDNAALMTPLRTKQHFDKAIKTGTFTKEQVQDIVGAMWSGNTETGATVTYQDSDGTLDIVVPATLTKEQVQDIVGDMWKGNTETGATVTYQDDDGTLDIVVPATLTEKQVQDIVGAMWSGNTETGATVTYQDDDGTLDISVSGGATLTKEQVQDIVGDMWKGNTETGATVTYQDSDGTLDISVAPTSITRATKAQAEAGTDNAALMTPLRTKQHFDKAIKTGTFTKEQVQDIVGAMWSGNTETGATVTYQDSDGTLDISVSGGATLTSEQVQDIVGAMWAGNTETGASVVYQDGDGTLDIRVSMAASANINLTDRDPSFVSNRVMNPARTYDFWKHVFQVGTTDPTEAIRDGMPGHGTYWKRSASAVDLS